MASNLHVQEVNECNLGRYDVIVNTAASIRRSFCDTAVTLMSVMRAIPRHQPNNPSGDGVIVGQRRQALMNARMIYHEKPTSSALRLVVKMAPISSASGQAE